MEISGKKFCFTGKFLKINPVTEKNFTRKELEEEIKSKGGIIKSSVTSDLDYLIPDDSLSVTPKAKEDSFKTINIKDRNNKSLYVGKIDTDEGLSQFKNIDSYLVKQVLSKARIGSSLYNLTNNEAKELSSLFNKCTLRNQHSCFSSIEQEAKKITENKENSNNSVIYFSKIIIFVSMIIILIITLGSKKEIINVKNRK